MHLVLPRFVQGLRLRMTKKGKLVILEGIDGCGKTTHAKLVTQWLTANGHSVLHTKEPSRGPIGLLLRDYLKKETQPLIDALLFTADRAEHVEKEINPAVEEGKIVVCERYYFSTIAYQMAQGLDKKWLTELNAFATKPDLVILLDLNPEVSVKRTSTNEKFETLDFLKKVNHNYKLLAKENGFAVVDASKGKSEVREEIRSIVQKII